MSSGQSKLSKQQLGTTNALGAGAQGTANDIYGNLQPFLQSQMTNPMGYSPADINAMTTASNQALGGSLSAAKGGAAEATARTRNQAGYAPALDESVRQAGQTQSQNALAIQEANAKAKLAQQQAGASGLQGLYGTNIGETEAMYGLGPSTIKAGQVPTWWQNLLGAAQQAGQTAATAMAM